MCQGHAPHSLGRMLQSPLQPFTCTQYSSRLRHSTYNFMDYLNMAKLIIFPSISCRTREYKCWWSAMWRIMNDWMLAQRYDLNVGFTQSMRVHTLTIYNVVQSILCLLVHHSNLQFHGFSRYSRTHNTSIDLMHRTKEYKRWWSAMWRIMKDWMLAQRYDLNIGFAQNMKPHTLMISDVAQLILCTEQYPHWWSANMTGYTHGWSVMWRITNNGMLVISSTLQIFDRRRSSTSNHRR